MKKMIVLACCIMVIAVLFYLNGVFHTRYIMIGSHSKLLVHQPYQELGFMKIRFFKKEPVNLKVEGKVNTQQIGSYELKYYDHDQLIGKRRVEIVDDQKPTIQLKQKAIVIYEQEEIDLNNYVVVKDNYDQKINEKLKISHFDSSKLGDQTVVYEVEDQSGNKAKVTLNCKVLKDPTKTTIKYNHDRYDNTYEEWWFKKSENHQRMEACSSEEHLKQFNAYYLGKNEKVIYLTYDEGGNDVTYIKEIVDVLNKHDVKATFFFTRNYLLSEQEFMKQLLKENHLIANHSWHHYNMSDLANHQDIDKFVLELTAFEKSYIDVLQEEMPKLFRFPKGGASTRTLQIVSELGYKTFFWSHAYYDFADDVSGQHAYETLIKHYHPGAIYMLHPSNKGNLEALERFIVEMKDLGYRFGLVDEIS